MNDIAFGRDVWFAATDAGLFATRDRGATWSPLPAGISATQPFRAAALAPDGGAIWAVGTAGLAASRDAGKSWMWSRAPLPQQGNVRLHAVDATTLLAATMDGLFVSRDGGASWEQAKLPEMGLRDAAGFGDAILVAPEQRGLYVSRDGGRSWSRVENAIAEGSFPVLAAQYASGDARIMWVASATEGLYALELRRGVQVSQLNAAGAASTTGHAPR